MTSPRFLGLCAGLTVASGGCAFEADLLMERDAAVDATPVADGGPPLDGLFMDASPWYDSGSAYGDATWNYSPEGGDGSFGDAAPSLYWPSCDKDGAMFDTARSGERCGFIGGCSRPGACFLETAYCTTDGTLLRSSLSKRVCEPDDPQQASCARVEEGSCCFLMAPCTSSSFALDRAGRFCSDGCEALPLRNSTDYVLGCADGVAALPWPPPLGQPCVGNFVCDSYGFTIGSTPAIPSLDTFGRLYFCQYGAIQQVVAGPSFPWN